LELGQLIPKLGKIPKPKIVQPSKTKKMELKGKTRKKKDNCPNCGVLVDLSDGKEFCPSCGGRIVLPELSIGGFPIKKKTEVVDGKTICSKCKKTISDNDSVFCPYCGESFQSTDIPEIPHDIIKQAAPAREFSGFYNSSDEVTRFFVPYNLQFSIFNGAIILGSLPSFQSLFVTREEFQANSDLLYKDISEIF
jgi:RNA polymerase subunit RPABC4/transcription elongation factor Spt4